MINIIYEDNEIIVCQKPSGIPSQPDKTGAESMLLLVSKYISENSNTTEPYLALVHRLDRNVGGLMVFAKTKKSAAHLTKSLQEKSMKKDYLAVVEGKAKVYEKLENFLIKNQRLNISKTVSPNTSNAKKAVLEYNLINSCEADEKQCALSLIQINLLTGRHHQIRVQLSNAGLAIWGDVKYNSNFIRKPGFHYIALWANQLSFPHPKNGKIVTFKSSPHKQFPFTEFKEVNA